MAFRFFSRPWLLRTALAASVAYVGVIVALLSLESTLLYRPHARGGYWSEPPTDLTVEEVWLQTADGTSIHAWWCPCPRSEGAVLFCRGNAGNLSHRAGDVKALQKSLGRSVLVFDYPGFGKSGGEPSEAGCYAAADAAYDWLTKRAAAEHILILGQSLGGGVATDLASRKPHEVLALFKTFTSFPDLAQDLFPVLPARWLVHHRFNNEEKIRTCRGPVFIAHGDCDHLIPVAHARELFTAAPGPKRLLVLEGYGHHGGLCPLFLDGLAAFMADSATSQLPGTKPLAN